MACGCATYICKEIFINPCEDATSAGIIAEEDGTYQFQVYFNGMVNTFSVQATEGGLIYIPTLSLNESYVHEVRITTPSNVTQCYWFNTLINTNVFYTPTDNTMWNWAAKSGIPPSTMLVDDERLTGDISPEIWNDGSGFDWAQNGVVQTATGLDFSAMGGIQGKLTWQYRNLPI